jgi:MoaA/NifB/PqqE/SkfB family radical SAM enzyme
VRAKFSSGGLTRQSMSSWWGRLRGRKLEPSGAVDAPKPISAPEPSVSNDDVKINPADTFCVLAWNHLQIAPNGTIKMCCIASEDVHENNRPMSLYTDSYENIWNSPYMRRARRFMAEGKRLPACARCFQEEKSVGQSRRTGQNAMWLSAGGESRERMIKEARGDDWKVANRPTFLQLNMGNLCNLACRMCSSQYSSKIENDPVHNKWMPAAYPDVARWRGKKLHFGPRPFFGVTYSGFHEYEAGGGMSLRWSSGLAAIKFKIPEGTIVKALGLKFRAVSAATAMVIRVNGLEVFQGEIAEQWEYRQDLSGLANQPALELEFESTVVDIGGRPLGVGLLDAWIERGTDSSNPLKNERTLMRFGANEGWWAQPEVMFEEILGQPDQLRYIILQGGEPFLVNEFDAILDTLIKNGSAGQVTFEIVSNLTVVKDSTLEKLAHFKTIHLGASIDGIGSILEYIRYPADWSEIERNLKRFSGLRNVQISFNTAIQAYNLLDLPNILQYCDNHGIDVHAHFLVGPRYLNVAVLPRKVRQIAVDRLTQYLRGNPRPGNRYSAEYAVNFLNEHLAIQYREEFPKFLKFTNDMDVSRGQDFRSLYPDLVEWLAEDGLHWTEETAHADRAKFQPIPAHAVI